MQKPSTNRLWCCVRYYLALCLSRGQADDTIRAKKYSLRKFCLWCFVRNVFTVHEIDIALMDDYMEYLNAYRKPKDNQPICKANKYALLLNVKTFLGKMHNRGVIENNPVAAY